MKKKAHMTFGLKMVLLAVGMGITLSVAALACGYYVFYWLNVRFYGEIGNTMAYALVEEITAGELDRYFANIDLGSPENTQYSYQPDGRYREIQNHLRDLQVHTVASDIYIGRAVDGVGLVILFDSEADAENTPLGSVYLSDAFAEHFDEMLQGIALSEAAIVDPDDPDYGLVLTLAAPFYREGGDPAGYYAMVDIPAAAVKKTQNMFIGITAVFVAVLTLVFVGIYLLVIRASFIKPMKQITRAVQSGGAGAGPKAFDGLKLKGNYELQALSDNFRNMLLEIEEHGRKQQELAVREQALKSEMALANDLNIAVLPKQLPRREEAYPFRVRGLIRRGEGLVCCFYDYFLLPGDRLCVMVGEVPGEGVPQVLFTVMAQAAIKSRLMSNLSLMETMTSANRQLYEMGGDMYLNVLVGILDGITGSFSCINAGLSAPLLMRSQEHYEPLNAFSYAPLGKNENVVYRIQEFKLRQGDWLFFYSEDADDNRDSCSGERLCRILNEAKVRRAEPEIQLQILESASVQGQVSGRAMLALEYRRRDKAKAHCVVTADAAGAGTLQIFLQEQLQANQVDERFMARIVVLGDELFALCRRDADEDSNFLVECAVRQDTVMLRVRGDMGGRDPLSVPTGGPAGLAAEYIRQNCEQASFAHDDFTDTVTLIKRV